MNSSCLIGTIRHFLAVARQGSTTAAAKAMRLSQSTVHRRLAELERRIAQRRHPACNGVSPHGVRRELLPLAKRVEDAIAAVERHLTATDDALAGSIRVTFRNPSVSG